MTGGLCGSAFKENKTKGGRGGCIDEKKKKKNVYYSGRGGKKVVFTAGHVFFFFFFTSLLRTGKLTPFYGSYCLRYVLLQDLII